jgi:hypothetical protein
MSEDDQIKASDNNKYETIPTNEILEKAKELDATQISKELLQWLTKNVPHYLDNTVTVYKVPLDDLDIAEGTGKEECPMTETIKLQNLYRGIDENDTEGALDCRSALDAICQNVIDTIPSLEDQGKELFDALAFFYQMPDTSKGQREKALAIDAELKEMGIEFERLQKIGEENPDNEANKEAIKELLVKIEAKIAEGNELLKFEEMKGKVVISKFDYEAFTVDVTIKSSGYDLEGNAIPEDQREVLKEYVMPEGFVLWFQIIFKDEETLPLSLF